MVRVVDLRRIDCDALSHALHEPLHLIFTAQRLILGWTRTVRQNFGANAQQAQCHLIRLEVES